MQQKRLYEAVAKDFRNFLFMVWKHLNLPDPTPVQYDIAQYLQAGPKRMIVEAFRGVGKSWITSAFVCWSLLNDPQLKILVVSASKERADAFSVFTKRLINELPVLHHLRPKSDQRDSNVAFDVGPAQASHAPSVKSVGISGQLTGSRANIIIADDVEVPNNSMTQAMREKLQEAVKEFDAVLSPGGRIVYLGTPQTEMSLYNVLRTRGYQVRIWPARYPENKLRDAYGEALAPFMSDRLDREPHLAGRPTDPKRFNEQDLLEREASYGRSGFALQFMLDTSVSDGNRYPLKLSDLIVMNVDKDMAPVKTVWASGPDQVIRDLPIVGLTGDRLHRPMMVSKEWSSYTGSVMAIDPSGRGKDETGVAIVKMLNGQLYCPVCTGFSGGYDEFTLTKLAKLARDHKVNLIIIEANFGDGMFSALFKPILAKYWDVSVEEVKHSTQKERRIIDTLEPVLNSHRLVVDEGLVKEDFYKTENQPYQLFYQLTRITRDRGALLRDDRLDALAIAVSYWVEQMSRDQDQAHQDHLEAMRDKELEKFMENVIGERPKETNWFSSVSMNYLKTG